MELRVIGRGALAGLIAGIFGFIFARIFAESQIDKAIDYESGRDDILVALNRAAGRPVEADAPEVFSRSVQSNFGAATGIIGFAVGMGILVAVAYLVFHGRFRTRPQTIVWLLAAYGFLGVYLLPFVKYPANPPAIGHSFTIKTRTSLYLTMVIASLVLLAIAAVAAHRLRPRFGMLRAVVLSAVGFFVLYGVLVGVLPSFGDLHANVIQTDQFGFARASTETPQPIVNILSTPLQVDGRTIQPGQIVYPGFDADVLWKFRLYSLVNQLLIWTTVALVFGFLADRFVRSQPGRPAPPADTDRIPVG